MTTEKTDLETVLASRVEKPDVEAIQARMNATTQGCAGWYIDSDREEGDVYRIAYDDDPRHFGGHLTVAKPMNSSDLCDPSNYEGGFETEADAQFVIHAQKDIALLLAYCAQLERDLYHSNGASL